MNMRDKSRETFKSPEKPSIDYLNTGAILRIADSLETLCKSRDTLETDRDMYRLWWEDGQEENAALGRTIAGLRGHITRLKKEKLK